MKSENSDRYNIIVISGPSGSGKSTLINRLVSEHRDIIFSVSHTTRPKRDSEIDGQHYHFVSEETFREMIDHNEFAEWAKVYKNYYGTSRFEIEQKSGGENNLVLDLDVQGAANIKKEFPSALFVFIVPPNLAELKKRLVAREKVIDSHIETRLKTAIEELNQYNLYDYTVINDKVDDAYAVLKSIYTTYNNATRKKKDMIENILKGNYDK
ncbi:guanylate kinase [Acidobacteriota bacterium]